MKRLKKLLSIGVVVAVLVALLVALPMPATTFAESDNITLGFTTEGGTPTLDTASSTLDFSPSGNITVTGTLITVSDIQPNNWWILTSNDGDGDGWYVQICAASATLDNETQAGKDLTLASSIATDNWTLTVEIDITDGGSTVDVNNAYSDPISELSDTSGAQNIGTSGSEVTILTAAAGEGLGAYKIKPKYDLELPGSVYYGTYSATLDITTTWSAP